ncbi:glycosyltransferase family 2 protein [Tepidibacillus fermentans]|uniref:Cellulose synthase (UDP-forming) n=1 Tax=Tepidibacillus fermentans TaxID=1281767 RepID=A0A4R3KHX2_9BACI|nr:glycosyltransferase [Tepidibacillus fermentans]TCS82921.1 cellulose synthase (UDP-forming) [Tepidibacillus fermentans]
MLSNVIYFLENYSYYYLSIQLFIIFLIFILTRYNIISRHVIIIYTVILETLYIIWRFFFTLVFDGLFNLIFSLLLYFWEFIGYFQQMIFYITMWNPLTRKTPELNGFTPTVDIFVPTYNESLDILKRTLVACTYIDYPREKLQIYVLDDGNRNEVKQLAFELGINYIARPDHKYAKAGNLNYALSKSSGELIVTLDADMVPKSNFLKETVGFFQKRKVGFVQAPQAFFNPDPFQYNLLSTKQIPNEQDFFMIEMQAGKDRFNATMYVGSNTIFSRQALNSIGGFAVGSITEDVATGMLIQAKGYRSFFVKKVLAKGLSAENFSELLHQRDRWCRGNIQAAKIWNPLIIPGLSIMQRLIYLSGIIYWFFGIQKLVYIFSPILYLLFNVQSIRSTLVMLLVIWLPKMISSSLTFRILSNDRRNIFWSHIYETAMAPKLALSAIKETIGLKSSKKFRVTNKGIISNKIHIEWGIFTFYSFMLILSLFGISKVIYLYFIGKMISSGDIMNVFWALYNLNGIIFSIFVSIEKPRYRKAERFPVTLSCKMLVGNTTYNGYIKDISESGAKAQFELSVPMIEQTCKIYIPEINSSPLSARVVFIPSEDRFTTRFFWEKLSLEQYKDLIKLIYDQTEDLIHEYKMHNHSGFLHTFLRNINDKLQNISRTKKRSNNVSLNSNKNSKNISM